MERKPKTIFQLDSPFTTSQWPQLSEESQNTILELLCSTLAPIGRYRRDHIVPSKGKRSEKRKRQEAKLNGETCTNPSPPPSPEILSFAIVGLKNITRILELSSQEAKPQALSSPADSGVTDTVSQSLFRQPAENATLNISTNSIPRTHSIAFTKAHFAAIFVLRSSQPAILHAHLPQLITTASLAYPELQPTKLVQLPKGCDARVCVALGLPRVSFIGILESAPHSKALIDLVRETVPDVELPWLKEVQSPKYLPVKINAIETLSSTIKVAKES